MNKTFNFNRLLNKLIVFALAIFLAACGETHHYAPVVTANQALPPNDAPIVANPKTTNSSPAQDLKTPTNTINNKDLNNTPIYQAVKPSSAKAAPDAATQKTFKNSLPIHSSSSPTKLANLAESNKHNNINKLTIKSNVKSQNKTAIGQNKNQNIAVTQENRAKNEVSKNTKIGKNLKKPADTIKTQQNNPAAKKNVDLEKSIISNNNKKVLKLNFGWPLMGKVSKNFRQTDNKGIDISGKTNSKVYASESGVAVYCGHGLTGYGNLVILKHDDTYLTAYGNNNQLFIKEGQKVSKGQIIGEVGSKYFPKQYLHFEIRKQGVSVNPLTLLPKH